MRTIVYVERPDGRREDVSFFKKDVSEAAFASFRRGERKGRLEVMTALWALSIDYRNVRRICFRKYTRWHGYSFDTLEAY